MKTVLILADFKPQSENATNFAIDFAKKYRLNVIMLHVITPEMSKSPVLVTSSFRDDNADYFEKVVQKMESKAIRLIDNELSEIDFVEYIVETGSIVSSIQKLMEDKEIDLVIMGSHPPHNYMERAGNTYTSDILQHINCSILVIPENVTKFKLDNITFASTLKDDQLLGFYLLGQWQKIFGCQVDVLYLNDPANLSTVSAIREKVDYLASNSLKVHEIYHAVHAVLPQKQIEDFVNDNHTDMLAMVSHKREGLSHLLQGSWTEDAVKKVHIPVLSFEAALLEG
jgi:nucleotide-binding universal stress UspA family protein